MPFWPTKWLILRITRCGRSLPYFPSVVRLPFGEWRNEFYLAALLGVLFTMGLRRVVSRAFEADCDRRAARVVGFSPTISAIYKVHAAHDLRNRGLGSVLAYACATHPCAKSG